MKKIFAKACRVNELTCQGFVKQTVICDQVHQCNKVLNYRQNDVVVSQRFLWALLPFISQSTQWGIHLSRADAVHPRRTCTHWLLKAYKSRIVAVGTSIVIVYKTCEGQYR